MRLILGSAALLLILATLVSWFSFIHPPSDFPTDRLIHVEEDASVGAIAVSLQEERVIRSSFFFRGWMKITGADREVHAGTYYFPKPLTLFGVAERIATGERGIDSVRVTLTEGMTSWEMGETLAAALPDFSEETFVELARPYEGYLFPDTYFIDPGTSPEQVVERLRETFSQKTEALQADIEGRGLFLNEVVTMASLIEKEADTPEDRRLVSGILWNRIESDMPLQVDAVFGYILSRSGYAPTGEDLELESPYNTYANRGLPPGPIANPGLDSLDAALYPGDTNFFYYLTGRDGKMYYATTFEAHKENRELYLD